MERNITGERCVGDSAKTLERRFICSAEIFGKNYGTALLVLPCRSQFTSILLIVNRRKETERT